MRLDFGIVSSHFLTGVQQYGVGIPDGLVILRYTHREAVRHEFGHMLGIGRHHIGCVMDYRAATTAFCNQCKRQIEEMWREEINQGR